MVPLLLADLRIDVNKSRDTGATPFFVACQNGHKEVVSLLLADLRIDVNKSDENHCTPLWFASQEGHLSVVQLILASGREVDTKAKSIAGTARWNGKTAAEHAHRQGTRAKLGSETEEEYNHCKHYCPLNAALIDSFDADPDATRQQLRELPELRDPFIGDLFALVVFLCDELLTVSAESSASSSTPPARRQSGSFILLTVFQWSCRWCCATVCLDPGRTVCSPRALSLLSKKLGNCLRARMVAKHSDSAFKKAWLESH